MTDLFRTSDGYLLRRYGEFGWTDGDLEFLCDIEGWPIAETGERLEGAFEPPRRTSGDTNSGELTMSDNDTTITTEAPAAEEQGRIWVTVQFLLSPEGQKAALIAGKSAAKKQEIAGLVPAEFLDLCEIEDDGRVVARMATASSAALAAPALPMASVPTGTPAGI